MLATAPFRNYIRQISRFFLNATSLNSIERPSLGYVYLVQCYATTSFLPKDRSFSHVRQHASTNQKVVYHKEISHPEFKSPPMKIQLIHMPSMFQHQNIVVNWLRARHISSASVELKTDGDVVRFSIDHPTVKDGCQRKLKKATKKFKASRKAKLNELKLYRLKAKKKMKSPNPEVRIRYKLEKAKRKEAWLIEKLRKYEVPKTLPETYDPEILTEEEKFYLKRTGEKKKNYVPVGRRGVFGGVVLNMHLHWKKHETVKVICKPCKPGQVHEYAAELARLSKGIIIDIKPDNTILFYRGKNYVQPDDMSPAGTLSKAKALEKYRYEQSVEHTSQFVEKLEKELEEYHEHLARFKKEETVRRSSSIDS